MPTAPSKVILLDVQSLADGLPLDSDTGDDMLGVSGASAIHAGNVDVLVLAAART